MNSPNLRWRPAYIGIGSNLNSPREQVVRAVKALGTIEKTILVRTSPLYRSEPLKPLFTRHVPEQSDYINAISALLTQLDAISLLGHLMEIERLQGRLRDSNKYGPRTIDLDLLVYSNAVIEENNLKVPHPGISERNFVLLPLLDIAPHLRIPMVVGNSLLYRMASVSTLAADVDKTSPRIDKLT